MEYMKFLEKDLEEIIEKTYKKDKTLLSKRGLYLNGVMKRQLRIGNYGIADLVTIGKDYDSHLEWDPILDKEGNVTYKAINITYPKLIITVYELKKDKIGISAYLQAVGYIKGLQDYFNKRNFDNQIDFNIVLIGNKVDTSGNFCYIPSVAENVEFYTYLYDVDGIHFINKNHYVLTNNGF